MSPEKSNNNSIVDGVKPQSKKTFFFKNRNAVLDINHSTYTNTTFNSASTSSKYFTKFHNKSSTNIHSLDKSYSRSDTSRDKSSTVQFVPKAASNSSNPTNHRLFLRVRVTLLNVMYNIFC